MKPRTSVRPYEKYKWLFELLIEDEARSADDLARTTGISRKIVDDAIYSLWREGRVEILLDSRIKKTEKR